MKYWRRGLALGVLLGLSGLALVGPWTTPGTRLLASLAETSPLVSIDGVRGSLFGKLRIERLRVQIQDGELTLRGIDSELRPACLLGARICFRLLTVDSISLQLPSVDGDGDSPMDPGLPPGTRIAVEHLAVGEFSLAGLGEILQLSQLEATRLLVRSQDIRFDRALVTRQATGRLTVSGRVRLAPGWPLLLAGEFEPSPVTLAALPANLFALEGPVAVSVDGRVDELSVSAGASFVTPLLSPHGELALRGVLRWPMLQMDSLVLHAGAGSLQAEGEVQLGDMTANLSLAASSFSVEGMSDYALSPVTGTSRVALQAAAPVRLRVSRTVLDTRLQDRPLHIEGGVTWGSDMGTPVLALNGDFNGAGWRVAGGGSGPFSYAFTATEQTEWGVGNLARIDLSGQLTQDLGRVTASGDVEGIDGYGLQIDGAALDLAVDLAHDSSARLALSLRQVSFGSQAVEQVDITAGGSLQQMAVTTRLDGKVAGVLRADVAQVSNIWNIDFPSLDLDTPLGRIHRDDRLSVRLNLAEKQLSFPDSCWRLDSLTLCLDAGTAGTRGALTGQVHGRPLLADTHFRGLASGSGDIAGDFAIVWEPQMAPSFTLDGTVNNIELTPAAVNKPLADPGALHVFIAGDTRSGTLTGELQGGQLGKIGVTAAAHLDSWHLDIDVGGASIDYFQSLLPSLARLEGKLTGAVRIGGGDSSLQLDGNMRLQNGALRYRESDAVLTGLDLALSPDREGLFSFAGSGLLGEGPVSLHGSFDPDARSLSVALQGDHNAVHWPGVLTATVSPDLALTLAGGKPELTGTLAVHGGRFLQGELPEGGVEVSPDTIIVGAEAPPVSVAYQSAVDVRIVVEERFRVVGSLIDATVGGDLRLLRKPAEPLQLFGRVNVVSGGLRAYGQQFELLPGSMGFVGAPDDPELDLQAERQFPSERLRAGFTVAGTLRSPELSLYSDPQLSREATLSWLVRGRGPDSGASMDGTALALSLGTSALNRSSVVESLNSVSGLSNVSFGAQGSADDTAATISGYVGDRLYLSYGIGLYEPINVLTARLYLRTRLWLEVVSRLENSVDLYYRFDID